MSKRPIIGITADYDTERAGGTHLIYNSYIEAVRRAGGVPLLLMPTVRTPENWGGDLDEFLKMYSVEEEILACCDGVLFTGGADVDPRYYGRQPSRECGGFFPFRDAFEINLTRICVQRNIPAFGICRGIQAMAAALGAELIQEIGKEDTDRQHSQRAVNWYPTHRVSTAEGSKLRELIGEEAWVNSFHHQAIQKGLPSYPFEITAWSEDGLIEGIEKPELTYFVGVQWHPERMVTDPKMRGLFEHFVRICAGE